MQLATSQRPHPPPVPPRPSRQVVAEALKRSPRPPCPTRQAPPPPNTRPWRSEDQKVQSLSDQGGRTVVYDSVKEPPNGEHPRSASEPRTVNELPQHGSILPRSSSNDETRIGNSKSNLGVGKTSAVTEKTEDRCGGTNRATSERNEAENHRERHDKPQQRQRQHRQVQQPQRRSNGSELYDWNNSVARMTENTGDIRSRTDGRTSISPDKIGLYEESGKIERGMLERKKDSIEAAGSEENNITPKAADSLRANGDAKNFGEENKTHLDQFANDNTAKSNENVKSTLISNGDDAEHLGMLSTPFAKKPDGRKDCIASTRSSATPTRSEKKHSVNNGKAVDAFETNEEPFSPLEEVESAPEAATSDSAATISGDDCTTVVVIDEPERKIAFNEDNDNIHHQDWLEAGVRYSSTKITLPADEPIDRVDEFQHLDNNDDANLDDEDEDELRAYAELEFASIRERIAMSSLQGLPPLPRSLSGFNLNEGRREAGEPPPPPARSSSKTPKNVKSTQPSSSRPSPPGRQLTTLDTQLAILRKEMFGLRQLDLSLLSQLWSLNESIQEFRQLLQEQEDRAPSPSPSSEEGDDISYGSHPPPPPRRPAPLLHHHRPPRPPRPLRPPASDESPSSEEYGAV